MSLTTALLLGQELALPKEGRRITHWMDGQCMGYVQTKGRDMHNENNTRIKARNISNILAAVASGYKTIPEIAEKTGLSYATVKKGLWELEADPDGARVLRNKGHRMHVFEVCK